MTDKDTITLPREVVELALDALEWSWGGEPMGTKEREAITALRTALSAPKQEPVAKAWAEGYQQGVKDERTSEASIGIAGFGAKVEPARQNPYGTALAAEQPKTPAWWRDGLAATLMREGVNKHRAREIAVGYWDAYCQIPGNEEEPT